MDQDKLIKRMQVREQKRKLLEEKREKLEAMQRKLDERERQINKDLKSMDNLQETDHSVYLLTCLKSINLNPVNDRAIILGTLALLQDNIKAGKASTEIDNAIKKYKELVTKGIVNEATFEKDEKQEKVEEE